MATTKPSSDQLLSGLISGKELNVNVRALLSDDQIVLIGVVIVVSMLVGSILSTLAKTLIFKK